MPTSRIISKTLIYAALGAILVGCAGFGLNNSAPTGASMISKSVMTRSGGTDIIIAAPDGFCINRATIDENPRGVFMFLSDCRVVDGSNGAKLARIPISSILTASISPSGLVGSENGMKPALTALRGFLETEIGTFTLGKSNVEGAVKILQVKQTDTALYLLIQDSAFQDDAGASNRYWRAFSQVNGRLVALSATSYSPTDAGETRSLAVIRAFMQAMLDSNAA